jgi:hypothetical protein
MAEVVRHPAFITTWVVVLLVVAVCGGLLLSTPIGRQLLVDERVRVTEAMGGRVDDAAYARFQSDRPVSLYLAYFTGGGRLLVTPPVTIVVALGVMALARRDGGAPVTFVTALAIAVHATVALAAQQVIATPLHYALESLTNPTNLAGLLGAFDEGSWPARLLGSIDVFGLWWLWLLAVGLAAATGRPARQYIWKVLAVYLGVAGIVAAVFVVLGNGV